MWEWNHFTLCTLQTLLHNHPRIPWSSSLHHLLNTRAINWSFLWDFLQDNLNAGPFWYVRGKATNERLGFLTSDLYSNYGITTAQHQTPASCMFMYFLVLYKMLAYRRIEKHLLCTVQYVVCRCQGMQLFHSFLTDSRSSAIAVPLPRWGSMYIIGIGGH